ncbi:MAG: BaiN/RdsA family NAD(P)/FAD-dependent oxidoreductase [Anaerolineae bacterium]
MSDRVIIVGGGPAGMMAAGRAAEAGAQALLIEKTPRLGNKLRLTGGGRGNVTHVGDARSIAAHLGPNGVAVLPALERFGPLELISFMRERDVPVVIEPDGRVFPASRNAHTIVAALRAWCLAQHVTFRYRSPVSAIAVGEGHATGVEVDDLTITAGAVVLATGGMSYPNTGSTGDGYSIAERLGHRIEPPAPGLVPLVASDPWIPALAGVSLTDVSLRALEGPRAGRGPRTLGLSRGDVLFTSYGISGPAVLDLSSAITRAFERGAVRLQIDLVPDTTTESLDDALQHAFRTAGRNSLAMVLKGQAPASLVTVMHKLACIEHGRPVAELSAADRHRVVEILKALELHLVATRPLQEAMVTVGGVATSEIDPATMASRRVPGLYLAGELIDVAGDSGGYNLQAAFSTGRLAGESAALAVQGAR